MVVAPEVPPERVAKAKKELLAKRPEPVIPGTRKPVVEPLSPPPEKRPAKPSVAVRPATAEPAAKTSRPPPRAAERAKVIPQPSPPAPQTPASAPVQTAQIPQQTPQERQTPPPVEPKPPAAPAAVQQPENPPERSVTPTPVRPSPKPPQVRLGGRWNLQPGGYSRSPAVPQSLSINVSEDGAGIIQGTLEARYRSQSKTERVSLSFAGRVVNGAARFPFSSSDGRRGEIEFIRIPNSADTMEVVWYGSDVKQSFDEIVKRGK